jgi:hypothetical protein
MNKGNIERSRGALEAQAAPRKYAVFISYRHADNQEPGRHWATWLHHSLETYEVPADLIGKPNVHGEIVPASLYPVFRDEEELPADADLSSNIRRALANSSLLVVLCSPRAASSRFVADEIRCFKELGRGDRILALILDGEPNASDDAAKQAAGISPGQECFPQPLRFGATKPDGTVDWTERTEAIAADVRPEGRPEQGYTSGIAFREALVSRNRNSTPIRLNQQTLEYESRLKLAKLKIIAGALGVPLGDLTRRDKAHQLEKARQQAKVLRRWLAALMLLTLTSLVAGALAWTQKREADRERDLAVERATEIENHNLAEKIARRAWYDLLANQPQTALASVQEALQLNPDLTWARPSLAHAQLLLGHYETAKSLYLTNKDLRFELNGRETSFTEQVLGDFSKLRQRGITNSDMQKIEALLKRKQAPIPGSPPPGK